MTPRITINDVRAILAGITPGEWTVEDPMGDDAGDDVWIVEAGKHSHEWRPIATACSCDPEDENNLKKIGPVERDRNARAIAAVPALLRAFIEMDAELVAVRGALRDVAATDRDGETWQFVNARAIIKGTDHAE